MKAIARSAAVAAALIAIASALYLRKSHEAVQRVTKPVELSAPDLFPANTALYVEMQGWDQSYARVETWWKQFESTATWLALQRGWKKDKLGLPPELVERLQDVDQELDRAEQKYGHRPTSRQFWESFGKHLAVGVLPAIKGERPRFLLATRLPDGGVQALSGHLSKAGGVKACEPPLHKGFPVFQEPVAGGKETLFYGVGRGYGFFSDSLPEIRSALERLAIATDGGKKPEGTLAHDAVLARVRPAKGAPESGVVYLRRDQKLADWMPELAPVDDFIRNAFVLAPKDEAVAFSLPDGRCSFHDATPKPWTKSLPPGLIYLEAPVPAAAAEAKKFRDAEAAEVFGKPLWKELDAFLSDPKRVKEFLAEAIPADDRPDDEIASRLPNDARFLGAWMKEWLLTAVDVEAPRYAVAMKVYSGIDSELPAQAAFGIDLDAFSVFLVAGGLDYVRTRWPEWLVREDRPGVLSWSLDMKRALKELREAAPPEAADWIESFVAPMSPSLIIAGNRVILVLGAQFAKEIAAGGPSFEDDPLFVEARGQVRPGYVHISWDRPWERIRDAYDKVKTLLFKFFEMARPDEETEEFLYAGLKAIKRLTGWVKPTRATLSTAYLDPAKPFEAVELVDPEAEKGVPKLVPDDAPARSPDLLPADVWLYKMQRIELKPAYDAMRAAFVEALPGGEERLKTMNPPEEMKEWFDALIDGLVRNVKGEVGFAIAAPRPRAGGAGEPGLKSIVAGLPAVIVFAEFDKSVAGFHSIRKILEFAHAKLLHELEHQGGFSSEFKVGMVGECRAAALDFFIPMGEETVTLSLCVVERGGFVFLTTSGEILKRFGSAKEKDEDSLSARLPEIPAKVSSLGLFHGDTLIKMVRPYLDWVARAGIGLTLRGYEDGPPPERVQAHLDGWGKWIDLSLDLFKTRAWNVSSTSRTGNTVKTTQVVVPEK